MSPITFKFFNPRGECRRVTYEDTPGLATIDKLVDSMVQGRRLLTYRDTEGDFVLLKTSRDLVEAVSDAKTNGSKSIRVQIRLVRECPRNNKENATPANNNNNNKSSSRNHCGPRVNCHRPTGGPQWIRCWGQGLFGHPHRISLDLEGVADEVDDVFKHFAPLFGIRVKHTGGADKAEARNEAAAERRASGTDEYPSKDENEHSHEAQETNKQVEETAKVESVASTPEDEAVPAPTIEATIEPQAASGEAGSGFTFVENEQEGNEAEEAAAPEPERKATDNTTKDGEPTPEDAVDEKLKLLKDMGFELPKDVARNMIKEMNGRMDLIVRALVANQK